MEQARDQRGRFAAGGTASPEQRDRKAVMRVGHHKRSSWPEAERARFLQTLALTCNVAEACRQGGGISHSTAYRHRRLDAGFRQAWRAAISEGYARLETEMLERALIAEARVRSAIAGAENDREALELLAKYPARTAELLYRAHRQTALDEDAATADPDGEEAVAELRMRIDGLRRQVVAERGRA